MTALQWVKHIVFGSERYEMRRLVGICMVWSCVAFAGTHAQAEVFGDSSRPALVTAQQPQELTDHQPPPVAPIPPAVWGGLSLMGGLALIAAIRKLKKYSW